MSTGHWTMSGKKLSFVRQGYFTTDLIVRHEVKKNFMSNCRLKTQKPSVSTGLYCFGFFMNILIDNLLMQFIHVPNRTMRLSKKILYQYVVVFFALLGTVSLLKTFHMSLHSTRNLKKI